MKINEIFYSIQGEGYWTGLPNIFIRLTGCNLRCRYCDTTYAYKDGEEMSISQIIEVIKKYPCEYVCITGGEPLINDQDEMDSQRDHESEHENQPGFYLGTFPESRFGARCHKLFAASESVHPTFAL